MARRVNRQRIAIGVTVVAVTGAAVLGATGCGDEANTSADAHRPAVVVEMAPPSPADRYAAQLWRRAKVLKEAVVALNRGFRLDKPVRVVVSSDAIAETYGPSYDPRTRTISVPYSTVLEDRNVLRAVRLPEDELDPGVRHVAQYTLYHEFAHALIDRLNLPITGGEENAADGLAAFLLTRNSSGRDAIADTSSYYSSLSDLVPKSRKNSYERFADPHAASEQRFYLFQCFAYGSDPETFAGLVDPEVGLPPERAQRCPEEASINEHAWRVLLEDHFDEKAFRGRDTGPKFDYEAIKVD